MCPKCKMEIDPKATKCPHCQSDLRSWERRNPVWAILLVLIFIPFFINLFKSDTPEVQQSPVQQIAESKKYEAETLAKLYVRSNVALKSPSTAKYGPANAVADSKDPNSFIVSSYVDSQNGFGAMIRSVWTVNMQYIGTDTNEAIDNQSNWKVKEVTFDGKKIN